MSTKTRAKPKPKPAATPSQPLPLPTGTEALLSRRQIADAIGVSVGMVKKLVATGDYPQPDTKIGALPRWLVATHNAWVKGRCGKAE